MGLFDNLFLDQNTPITINDGVDHSKDAVMAVVDPNWSDADRSSTGTTSLESTQDDKKHEDKKKDDSIADLFESDKKEEKEAIAKMNPEPPKDIALEIGKSISTNIAQEGSNTEITSGSISSSSMTDAPLGSAFPPADPTISLSSFDIGGDISFDSLPESTISEPLPISGDQTSTPSIEQISSEEIKPEASTTPPLEGALGTSLGTEGSQNSDIQNLGENNISNSTPQAISGTFLSPTEVKSQNLAIGVESSPTQEQGTFPQDTPTPPVVTSGEGGILDLIGGTSNTPEAVKMDIPPPVSLPDHTEKSEGNPSINLTSSLGFEGGSSLLSDPSPKQTETTYTNTNTETKYANTDDGFSSLGASSTTAMLGKDALALLREGGHSSSLLRERLTSFIDDLKVLHSRDQSQRYHKLEQIAMYEERIREIDAEAASRKRVLQMEIEDLKRQIELMDKEKNDIQEVISSFHKEVGVS